MIIDGTVKIDMKNCTVLFRLHTRKNLAELMHNFRRNSDRGLSNHPQKTKGLLPFDGMFVSDKEHNKTCDLYTRTQLKIRH